MNYNNSIQRLNVHDDLVLSSLTNVPKIFNVSIEELSELNALNFQKDRRLSYFGGILGLCQSLLSDPQEGLCDTKENQDIRVRHFGRNVMDKQKHKSLWVILLRAVNDVTLLILISAAVLSIVLAFSVKCETVDCAGRRYKWTEAIAILVSVVVAVSVTAANDYTKEKHLQKLSLNIMQHQKISVVRCGVLRMVSITDILVGDVCLLKTGDLLAADGILINANDLRVDESSLTGDSRYVNKHAFNNPIVWQGTIVMEGNGRMLVTAVGINTQAGHMYELLRTADTQLQKTVLQKKLRRITLTITIVGIILSVTTVLIMIGEFVYKNFVVENNEWEPEYYTHITEAILLGITLVVLSTPEGIPLSLTVSMAYTVKTLMFDNILVRVLDSCELMGRATAVCCDKTGTLTTNQLTVTQIFVCNRYHTVLPARLSIPQNIIQLIAEAITINTPYSVDVKPSPYERSMYIGNRIECSLLQFVLDSLEINYNHIRQAQPEENFVKVYNFNSKIKMMSTVVQVNNKYRVFTKGAAELVLDRCAYIISEHGRVMTLTSKMKQIVHQNVIKPMASEGLVTMTIAFTDRRAFPRVSQLDFTKELEIVNHLTCICIVGIEDPIREYVRDSVQMCKNAGITVRMVTGDHINTSRIVALKCGIIGPGEHHLAMDSEEFNKLVRNSRGEVSQGLLDNVWPQLRILARSTPEDKYNLVYGMINSTLNKKREVVAVTGDGTNDASALRVADIGFAMGISGTEVAKQASDIILIDDDFLGIVKAMVWGRNIYDNILKMIQFQLTTNITTMLTALISASLIRECPLRPVQLLWINLIIDSLAALIYSTEQPTEQLLHRQPYSRNKRIVTRTMCKNIITQSAYELTVIFFLLFYGDHLFNIRNGATYEFLEPSVHYTLIFNSFVMMILCNQIYLRKLHSEINIFEKLCQNNVLEIIFVIIFIVQILIVQFGGLAFSTRPLSLDLWFFCICFGLGSFIWGFLVSLVVPKSKNKNCEPFKAHCPYPMPNKMPNSRTSAGSSYSVIEPNLSSFEKLVVKSKRKSK